MQISFAVTAKISFAVTAKLICVFVFAYAKSRFSHNEAHVCAGGRQVSDFIWDFGKLPFPAHLGIFKKKIGKISAKIHEIGKIKAIFRLGMTPL